ncbi:unnamed protein product [Rotaria sp. Silwood2]|nr:unnamed protein product [Rotaria sp. Silwood2]
MYVDEECEEAAVKKRYLGIVTNKRKKLTSIQRQAISIGLQNRDVIGIAETNSDKTAGKLILVDLCVFFLCLFVIGISNRLIDVLENRYLILQQCIYIVMDVAYRRIG